MIHTLQTLVLVGLCLSVFPDTARAQDKDATAIIERAIKAIGGKEKAAARTRMTWSAEGTYHGGPSPFEYAAEYAVEWPDKMRFEVVELFVIVLNGDKGWVHSNGATQPMDEKQLEQQREAHLAGWVSTLLPLLDEKNKFKLKVGKEQKVDKRPAVVVKVSKKKFADVDLLFDKETGLLVKSVTKAKAPELDFKEVTVETWYKSYKAVDGLKIPHHILVHRDGEVYVDGKNDDVRFVKKHDKKTFAEP